MLEFLTAECWLFGDVERQIKAHHFACPDLGCCYLDAGWGEEVQTTDVVVGSPYPGGVFWSAGESREVFAGWERSRVRIPGDGVCMFAHDRCFDLGEATCDGRLCHGNRWVG